ncbi:MAG: hypothetical protein AAB649_05510, partial [Patescibacteria group bacterium]
GHNPAAYLFTSDKWIDANIDLLNSAYPFITVLLVISPWIFYFLQRKKHHKQFLWIITKFSIAGLLLGLFLPTLVIWITGALAVRALYGG